MNAMKRSGKRGGFGIIPDITVFGMSKDGALPCDQNTDVKVIGWRQDTYLPRDVGGMAAQRRANDVPAEW